VLKKTRTEKKSAQTAPQDRDRMPLGQLPTNTIDLSGKTALIKSLWRNQVVAYVDIGQELNRAKDLVDYGEFAKWVERELPFSVRTAERLMALARNAVLANPTHASHLPPHWDTLYELSRLDELDLEKAIVDGRVTPRTERKDVARLWPPKPERSPSPPSQRQKRELAERTLRSLVGAVASVGRVDVRDLLAPQQAEWEAQVGSALVILERKQDELKTAMGKEDGLEDTVPQAPAAFDLNHVPAQGGAAL
jgi:hypothetical protein